MDKELKERTSKRIKELRTEHKYTMETLAEKIGVSKSTIAKWENGYVDNMRQDNIVKLAEVFNVPATYILGYVEEEKADKETQFIRLYSHLPKEQQELIDNMLITLSSKQ